MKILIMIGFFLLGLFVTMFISVLVISFIKQ